MDPDEARARTRIAAARRARPKVLQAYVRTIGGDLVVDECRCKLCGRRIAALIPHDRFPDRMVYAALPGYQLVRLTCDDGTLHETPLCTDHVLSDLDADDLEAVYAADLAQFAADAAAGGGTPRWKQLAGRRPVKAERA